MRDALVILIVVLCFLTYRAVVPLEAGLGMIAALSAILMIVALRLKAQLFDTHSRATQAEQWKALGCAYRQWARRASIEDHAFLDELEEKYATHRGPSVVLVRHTRSATFDPTHDGASWFGGQPTLKPSAWPRDHQGRPMAHLAQIDLGQVVRCIGSPKLPRQGALAFFVNLDSLEGGDGKFEGAVAFIRPTSRTRFPLPEPLPAFPPDLLPRGLRAEHPKLFPRMAIEMASVTPEGDFREEDFTDGLEAAFGPAPMRSLSLHQWSAEFPQSPVYWDSVARLTLALRQGLAVPEKTHAIFERVLVAKSEQLLAAQAHLETAEAALVEFRSNFSMVDFDAEGATGADPAHTGALDLREGNPDAAEAQSKARDLRNDWATRKAAAGQAVRMRDGLIVTVDRLKRQIQDFDPECERIARLADDLTELQKDRDPWAMVPEVERKALLALLAEGIKLDSVGDWLLRYGSPGPNTLSQATEDTIRVLAVAPNDRFLALPRVIAGWLNGPGRQIFGGAFHSMFGAPANIQGAPMDNDDRYLLLQLASDDIQGFEWGGVLQYWISPADLHARNWSAVNVTFETD